MKISPAIRSAISPDYLAEFVIDKYDFSRNTSCSVIKLGINDTYLIKDNQNKYILRVYNFNWSSKNEINEELELLLFLKENNIFVSYPIQDNDSKYIQNINAIEGERFAVLFSYAQGETIKNPSNKICHNLGLEMAKMHQVTLDKKINRKNYDAKSLVNWSLKLAEKHFSESLEEVQYIKRANQIISSQFNKVDSSKLRHGTVHLDLWYDNIKVKEDSTITMFDFDNCGNGWLFLDIGYSLMLLYRNEPNKELFKDKIKSFYDGYETITTITKEEKRLIPYGGLAIWLHFTGIHIQRFDNFSNIFLSEDFLKYWIDTVNNWMIFNQVKI